MLVTVSQLVLAILIPDQPFYTEVFNGSGVRRDAFIRIPPVPVEQAGVGAFQKKTAAGAFAAGGLIPPDTRFTMQKARHLFGLA